MSDVDYGGREGFSAKMIQRGNPRLSAESTKELIDEEAETLTWPRPRLRSHGSRCFSATHLEHSQLAEELFSPLAGFAWSSPSPLFLSSANTMIPIGPPLVTCTPTRIEYFYP